MLKHATRPAADTERYQNISINNVRRPQPHPLHVATLDKHSASGTSPSVSPAVPPPIQKAELRPRPSRKRAIRATVEEALTSLALLCIVSLLLALLALLFLLKISAPTPASEEFAVVYEVTLALCALTLSLNLCCLLVCAIQFLFAVKLVHSPAAPNGRLVNFKDTGFLFNLYQSLCYWAKYTFNLLYCLSFSLSFLSSIFFYSSR